MLISCATTVWTIYVMIGKAPTPTIAGRESENSRAWVSSSQTLLRDFWGNRN